MSDLTQLYQDIILRHNKHPRNYGPLENYTGKARGYNPLCGDEVTVYWKIDDGKFSEIRFEAKGCAISRASASMMTELLHGKQCDEAKQLFSKFSGYFTGPNHADEMDKELGDLITLSGVRKYPSRIKCATLAWHALLESPREIGNGPG